MSELRAIILPEPGHDEMLQRLVGELRESALHYAGREVVLREKHGCMIGAQQACLFGHECQTVYVINEAPPLAGLGAEQ